MKLLAKGCQTKRKENCKHKVKCFLKLNVTKCKRICDAETNWHDGNDRVEVEMTNEKLIMKVKLQTESDFVIIVKAT